MQSRGVEAGHRFTFTMHIVQSSKVHIHPPYVCCAATPLRCKCKEAVRCDALRAKKNEMVWSMGESLTFHSVLLCNVLASTMHVQEESNRFFSLLCTFHVQRPFLLRTYAMRFSPIASSCTYTSPPFHFCTCIFDATGARASCKCIAGEMHRRSETVRSKAVQKRRCNR